MKLKIRGEMTGVWTQFSEKYGFLGHLLHSERLLKRISVESVAKELNLSTYIIQSLETGQLNQTPGFSYMVGFVRTYAEFLGLNGEELISLLRDKSSHYFSNEAVFKLSLKSTQIPNRWVVLGSVLSVCLIWVVYLSFYKKDKPSAIGMVKLDPELTQPMPQSFVKIPEKNVRRIDSGA